MWYEPNCSIDLDVYKDWLYEFNDNDDLREIDFNAMLSLNFPETSGYHRIVGGNFIAVGEENYIPPGGFSFPYIRLHDKGGNGLVEYEIFGDILYYFGDDNMQSEVRYYGYIGCGI